MNILITHIDLDGIGAAVIAKAKGLTNHVIHSDYTNVDDAIKIAVNTPDIDTIYIVDISPQSDAAVQLLDNFKGTVKLYDHHATAQDYVGDKPWAIIDQTRCGTKLFAEVEKLTDNYEDFIYHVNDYDLWIHESPKSKDINMLVWLVGQENFIQRFIDNPSTAFSDQEQVALNLYKEKRNAFVEDVVDKAKFVYDKYERVVAVTISSRYTSQVGETILAKYPQVDYVVIIDLDRDKASLRSRDVDVRAIAEMFGGGGHTLAAGFNMPAHALVDRFLRRPRRFDMDAKENTR